jgi:hypothetical protein
MNLHPQRELQLAGMRLDEAADGLLHGPGKLLRRLHENRFLRRVPRVGDVDSHLDHFSFLQQSRRSKIGRRYLLEYWLSAH